MLEKTAVSRASPPDAIPGYRLEQLVGTGGMGQVHRAVQLSLGRTVAVKVLASELSKDAAFVTRFEKEAAALAALSHPNIVSIVDKGSVGTTYYLVMEFIDGPSLREKMRTDAFDTPSALLAAAQVCRALAYAHGRGIIHRDLKPENILFDEQAGSIPKVTDFGLAGFLERDQGRFNVTQMNASMGTLKYMAPEQQVDARTADHRADIFSFGVILYELLTGEVPVGAYVPPSKRRPGIDRRLDDIVARALKPDPKDRYQQASELLRDLEPFAPVSFSHPPSRASFLVRARRALRQTVRTAVKAISVALVLAAAVVLVAAVLRPRSDLAGSTREMLSQPMHGPAQATVAGNVSADARGRKLSFGGPGLGAVPLNVEGGRATLNGNILGLGRDSGELARATIALPDMEGEQLIVATVDAPIRARPWWIERAEGLVLGAATTPRAALLLEGAAGQHVALIVPPAGEPLLLEWRLNGGEGEMLGPPMQVDAVRLQLSVNGRGELRALVGPGEGKALGPPLVLGSEWWKEFVRRPVAAFACTARECTFRNVAWEVQHQP